MIPASAARPGDVVLISATPDEAREPFVVASVRHADPVPGRLVLVDAVTGAEAALGGADPIDLITRHTTTSTRSTK